jgi:hypothetical protein
MQVPVQPKPTITKAKTRIGNLGHLTRIANRMIQASASNSTLQIHLQANPKWNDWVSSKLQPRNVVENVLQWSCGYDLFKLLCRFVGSSIFMFEVFLTLHIEGCIVE